MAKRDVPMTAVMVEMPNSSQMLGRDRNNRKGFKTVERRHNPRNMDFEGFIKDGENKNGMTAQTVNGTAHASGTGWNKRQPYTMPQVEPEDRGGRGRYSNRSGE